MQAQVVSDWAVIEMLAPEWNRLLERSRARSIFLTWEWVSAWRATVGESVEPLVVVARDEDGTLAGIGPFYVTSMRLGGIVRYRALRVLGDQCSGADYADWIVREDREQEASRAIAEALAGVSDRWHTLWIPAVAGWTGARERIADAVGAAGFHCHERPREFSSIALSEDYPTYERSLSPGTRSILRRRKKALFAAPGTRLAVCQAEDDLPIFLDALLDLHHRRWSAAGEQGAFVRKPSEARFHRAFTRLALERGWLRFYAIKIGPEFEAAQLGYVYGGVFYQTHEGFNPEGPAAVASILRGRVIEECIAEGVRTYDFLGEHTEHKRRWRAEARTGSDLFIGRRGLKNALLFSAEVWPTGKYLRPESLAAAQ